MTPLQHQHREPTPAELLAQIPARLQYDAARNLYWVPVSPELLGDLVTEWSEPVQVKIENGEMVFRRGGSAR